MKKYLFLTALVALLFLLTSCGLKTNSKNMEQIQKEEGIPVRVTKIKPTTYTQTNTYNAVLSGIEESVIKSMVSDVVLKINAKVGDYVKKDQIVMTFPQDTPSAQYIQASSGFQNAKATYERMQRLFNQGAISQQDMDNVTTAYKVAQANLNTSQSMINVKAPISGYLTAVNVNQGDKVDPGAELFTVSNTSSYKAVIWIPDSEIQDMKKGMKATAAWNNEIMQGYISSIAMAMDQNKKAFRAEVRFTTKTKYIASGVTVDIKINTLSIAHSIVIPRTALTESGDKLYAWVVENNKAVKKELQAGHNNGIDYEIKSGLNPDDMLITEGTTMVYEGCLVKISQ